MFKQKDLNNKIFVGVVENVNDEERKGRIQVRVQSLFDKIELEHIPWAEPQRSLDGRSYGVPALGKTVNIIFVHGNIYEPQYIYSQNYNSSLLEKLNDLSDEEYTKFSALLFDERTQLYADDINLRLDYKFNQISLKEDGIDVHLKDNDQELHLGHNYADQSAVLGDHFMEWMDGFMNTLLQPSSLIGNIGAPVLKPLVDSEIMKYQALRQTFLSQHVKIVDNANCLDTGEDRKNVPANDDMTKLNDERILESTLVDEEVKKEIKEKRTKDAEASEESKPNPDDAAFKKDDVENNAEEGEKNEINEIPDGPSREKVTVPPENIEEGIKKLSDEDKLAVEKSDKITERKNTKRTPPTFNFAEDPYADQWVGHQGRTAESFETETTTNQSYGTYSNGGATAGTGGNDAAGGGSTSVQKYKGKASTRKTKDGRVVTNGKLEPSDLVAVKGFHIYGKPATINLEKHAAIKFAKFNEAFKREFGFPLSINGNSQHYRTYDQQMGFWIKYKNGTGNLAARPGTSNHGWGIAIDVSRTAKGTGKYYTWMMANAGTYNIKRTVHRTTAKESWHWVYKGPTIYA